MPGGGGGTTTSIQDIPPSFRPAFNQLFNSAFGAARQASGQDPFGFGGLGGQQPQSPFFLPQTPLQAFGGDGGFNPGGAFGGGNFGFGNPVGSGFQPQQQGQPQSAAGFNAQRTAQTPQQTTQIPQGFGQEQGVNQRAAVQNVQPQQQASFDFDQANGFFDAFNRLIGQPAQGQPSDGPEPFRGGAAPGARQGGPPPAPSQGETTFGNPNFGAIAENRTSNFGQGNIPLAAGPPIVGQAFPGQFTAGSSPLEAESLARQEELGRQLTGAGNTVGNLGQFTAAGGFLNPESNPFLQANIEASLRPAIRGFQESALPAFDSGALNAGAFKGSSARDFAANTFAQDFGQNIMDAASKIGFQNFANERGLQQNAGQLINQGAGLNQLSPDLLARAGLGQRQLAQRPLDEQLLQFTESVNAPFRPLGPLANIIQGTDVGAVQSTTVPQPSAVGQGISSAFGGGAAGGAIANAAGFGNTGQLVGAGAGGLTALLTSLLS